MPQIEEIGQMEKNLHPEIAFVGYEDKKDHLLWDFNYTYPGAQCKVAYSVRIKTDMKGKVLKVSGNRDRVK